MTRLTDLIEHAGIELADLKVHFATNDGFSPLSAYYDGTFKEWQERQSKPNFECRLIIGLIHLAADQWLFAGLWRVHGCVRRSGGLHYETTEVGRLEHLTGRAIVSHPERHRSACLRGERLKSKLLVSEIRPERMSLEEFPGYMATCLRFDILRVLVRQRPPAWVDALQKVGGIYLVTDTNGGQSHVASACGEGGIWARWEDFARTGHGGNEKLKLLLMINSFDYASNFQLSILEVCDQQATKDEVNERTAHWKDVLLTRRFGYDGSQWV